MQSIWGHDNCKGIAQPQLFGCIFCTVDKATSLKPSGLCASASGLLHAVMAEPSLHVCAIFSLGWASFHGPSLTREGLVNVMQGADCHLTR